MAYRVPNLMVVVNKKDKELNNALVNEGIYYTWKKEYERFREEEGVMNLMTLKMVSLASARALHNVYGGKEVKCDRNNNACFDIKNGDFGHQIVEVGSGEALSKEEVKEVEKEVVSKGKRGKESKKEYEEMIEGGGINWYKSMMWVIWAVGMLNIGEEVDESGAPSKIALGWYLYFKKGEKDMVKMFCKDIIPKTLPNKAYFEKIMAFKDDGEDLSEMCEELIRYKMEIEGKG